MPRFQRALPIALFLLIHSVTGRSDPEDWPVLEPIGDRFVESFLDEVPVGGQVVVGVGLVQSEGQAGSMFAVWYPGGLEDRAICVRVVSQDGRYWAENEFSASDVPQPGFARLDYRSRRPDDLWRLSEREVAVLAYPGPCARRGSSEVLVSNRSPDANGFPRHIRVIVNSGRSASTLRVRTGDEWSRPIDCDLVEDGRRSGFDTICEFDVDGTPSSVRLRILRRKYGRIVGTEELTVVLGR